MHPCMIASIGFTRTSGGGPWLSCCIMGHIMKELATACLAYWPFLFAIEGLFSISRVHEISDERYQILHSQ